MTRFCARAVLLYGVPFHYLVPDERMMPPESIRFFHVDPGWIATLIQGATSVGRAASATRCWTPRFAIAPSAGP